ncbi:Ig-like domain-containing protein [Solirubrobacter deserti]|uniref:Ig-like domain-containing protein n=1 Tax=Solirubrobacter deserti TaxID=2282478 RepID=A0ABT4RMV9_9ACTN|nr:Ig-like domain-containing protein [Solirubrobacter deserti]MDA0139909.1 Ig-like domain-containing protein [Solirubrobacter deserti]
MLVAAGVLCSAQSAFAAATLTVDDDKADCPAAGFTSVQAAVDAAADGDTIVICQGKYVEGNGAPGTNAVTIQKNNLTLKGAGAHLVSISPKASGVNFGSILEPSPDVRNGVGDIIAVVGTPTRPLTANISGVTVNGYDPAGRPVAVEAGIAFVDAKGSVKRSHVTNVVTSEGDNAYQLPGGWRGPQPGIGIVQTSRALLAPVDGSRRLEIDRTRIDKYNRIGVLIDGAQNDFAPFTSSGVPNWGVITSSQIVGRTLCVNYAGTGACANPGQVRTGPTFGQDGLRVTAGAYATVDSSLISQNLVHGEFAAVRSTTTPASFGQNPQPARFNPSTTNNQNLVLGSGVRYAGARLTQWTDATGRVIDSSVSRSNIVDNSFGALNVANDGTTTRTGNVNANEFQDAGQLLKAENNWWGVRNIHTERVTPPPAIIPAANIPVETVNPPAPENPVNGTSVTEAATGGATSNSVDFFPYRSGPQSDPASGAWPVLAAPIPVLDRGPTGAALSAPASAQRGTTITLTAAGEDDFALKRVRFADGGATIGTATQAPYSVQATIPADAACDSTRTYSAVVMDNAGQTASASATVAVTCPAPNPNPGPAAPTIAFANAPATLSSRTRIAFTPTAAAGVKQVELFLGDRRVCTLTSAPFDACEVTPTGADVGRQALRVVVTDLAGSTAQATVNVTVAKFATSVTLKVKKSSVRGGKTKRTINGTLKVPANVTKAQACSGKVTITIKRNGRSVLNQAVNVSRNCTFSRSVTAARKGQSFSVSAKYAGNAVLRSASESRRFS